MVLLFDFIYLFEKSAHCSSKILKVADHVDGISVLRKASWCFRTMVVVSHIHCAIERWDKVRINFVVVYSVNLVSWEKIP